MKVELKRDRDGLVRAYDIEHATNLLRFQPEGQNGWKIDDDKYKFNGYDIIKKSSKKRNRKPDPEADSDWLQTLREPTTSIYPKHDFRWT